MNIMQNDWLQQVQWNRETEDDECYAIFAGKDATADGSVLGAHNDDLTGNEAGMLAYYPRMKHSPDETVSFETGLIIPEAEETCGWMVQKIHTGFAKGDAVAINEYGVSVVGGNDMTKDRNVKAGEAAPLVERGLTGKVRYVALQRSKTARECVETLGALYTRYGLRYLSGVGIADANEVWYIEALGGRQWIAIRIPDDQYFLVANAYRIQVVDTEDFRNVMQSPDLTEFCRESGLWNPEQGPVNFARAFGGGKVNPNPYYDSRRVWEGQRLLTPSLEQDPDIKVNPMFLKPDRKLTVASLANVLRSHYENTPFDVYSPEGGIASERPIAVPQTIHFSVVQLRSWLPAGIGSVLWSGMGSPLTTPLVPQYFAAHDIHSAYQIARSSYDDGSAWWTFNNNTLLAVPHYQRFGKDIVRTWKALEEEEYAQQERVDQKALELYHAEESQACAYLSQYSQSRCSEALAKARAVFNDLRTKLSADRHFPNMR